MSACSCKNSPYHYARIYACTLCQSQKSLKNNVIVNHWEETSYCSSWRNCLLPLQKQVYQNPLQYEVYSTDNLGPHSALHARLLFLSVGKKLAVMDNSNSSALLLIPIICPVRSLWGRLRGSLSLCNPDGASTSATELHSNSWLICKYFVLAIHNLSMDPNKIYLPHTRQWPPSIELATAR